jgi:hypothetical protein
MRPGTTAQKRTRSSRKSSIADLKTPPVSPFVLTYTAEERLTVMRKGRASLFYHRFAPPVACFSAASAVGAVGPVASEMRNRRENGENALSAGF